MVGNVTDAFRRKGMWDDMLMVMSTDNGGPIVRSLGLTSCFFGLDFILLTPTAFCDSTRMAGRGRITGHTKEEK